MEKCKHFSMNYWYEQTRFVRLPPSQQNLPLSAGWCLINRTIALELDGFVLPAVLREYQGSCRGQGACPCPLICHDGTHCVVWLCSLGDRPPAPARSFAMHWSQRCETSWRRAFLLFRLGVLCCFGNFVVAAWIKFEKSMVSCAMATAVIGGCLLYGVSEHRNWTAHILEDWVDQVS